MKVKEYETIVVGSGCGMIIVEEAIAHGLKVALVDRGPLGGTCLNTGLHTIKDADTRRR